MNLNSLRKIRTLKIGTINYTIAVEERKERELSYWKRINATYQELWTYDWTWSQMGKIIILKIGTTNFNKITEERKERGFSYWKRINATWQELGTYDWTWTHLAISKPWSLEKWTTLKPLRRGKSVDPYTRKGSTHRNNNLEPILDPQLT